MFEYLPGSSLLHQLDVRTKALGFLMVTVLAFLFTSPIYNLALAFLCLGFVLYVGLPFSRVADRVKSLISMFIIIIVITGVSYPRERFETPIAQRTILQLSQHLILTSGGLLYGLTFLFRILVMVLSSSVLTYTTPLGDFLQLLQKMRMPYQLAFVLTTAIRFVPTMERKTMNILDAQRARGAQLGTGGVLSRIRTYVPVLVPMMVGAMLMSESLAVAMLNRGYGARTRATPLKELQMEARDYIFSGLCLVIIMGAVVLRRQGFGQL